MELSLFLAKAWGLYLLIIGIALLLRKKDVDMLFGLYKHHETVLLSGIVEVAIGIVMILSHNIWTLNWQGVVTLLGWFALIRGITRLLFPDVTVTMAKKLKNSSFVPALLIIVILLGAYLTYVGFTF